ncbi:hypothetical protein [Mucilaginibacter sp. L3T2-6]|uniref:hypothetical protein n=1 Tax=Mucilaginibacter sp. L3T2-6 TaxID=3062491 RepID=UPI002676D883|nr:hypothetical protein [Mucilaginibacter sp. L3T2-6]MDO3642049.1 hypothetical protein [Mucilaginibacter sp. L3T2-6]MDV6214543.1 hypothetical protein [Mucilaginibacter sp. L3T2-6]
MTDSTHRTEKTAAPKAILWLSILMILLFLYQMYTQFGLLKYMLINSSAKWDLPMVMYFLRPLLVMPAGAILFALHKKSGWVLSSGYFNYLAINTIMLSYFAYRHPANTDNKIGLSLPATPVNSLFSWTIFIAGCLYFIYKKEVRDVYAVNKLNIAAAATLGIALCISAIL